MPALSGTSEHNLGVTAAGRTSPDFAALLIITKATLRTHPLCCGDNFVRWCTKERSLCAPVCVCVCVCRPGIAIKAQTARFNMPTILPIISETMSSEFEGGHAGRPATSTLINSFGCGEDVRAAAPLEPAYLLSPAPRSEPWQTESRGGNAALAHRHMIAKQTSTTQVPNVRLLVSWIVKQDTACSTQVGAFGKTNKHSESHTDPHTHRNSRSTVTQAL